MVGRILGAWMSVIAALGAADDFSRDIAPLIDTHCSDCHSSPKGKGDIHLDLFKTTDDVLKQPERWEGVLQAVRAFHMPPPKDSDLSAADRAKLVAWISTTLETAYRSLPPDPGPPVLRRLTRAEYDRTVRDLLGVDLDLSRHFPPDGGGGEGFQNNADTLFVPPLLLEKLLAAATEAVEAAPLSAFAIEAPASDSARDRKKALKTTVENFGLRAFRQPLMSMEPERWLRVYELCIKKGLSEEIALRQTFRAMLASPKFIFRMEVDKKSNTPWQISSYEMASRLSYFLWGSMPDATLFALAAENRLQDDVVIAEQVRRMLADPKARAFTETFAIQWLRLDTLREGAGPDPGIFPEYTPELRESMIGEATAFMHGLVTENGSILDLLDCNYTWVDGRLARHYGIAGSNGDAFTKVTLPGKQRGGVTGMAAVLTVTSHPGRTSPVLRGAWVIDRLLDSPPPPPPPNVAQLPKDDSRKEAMTVRQRLEAHRKDPNCAACHDRIDPVGHPLEHFDPLGRWIDRDIRGVAIDPTGTLPDGTPLTSPESLRKALMDRRDRFAEAFARKLLGYALGRGIIPADRPTLSQLRTELERSDYRIDPLIVAICTSFPFRNRISPR